MGLWSLLLNTSPLRLGLPRTGSMECVTVLTIGKYVRLFNMISICIGLLLVMGEG